MQFQKLPLIKPSILQLKSGIIRGVKSLEVDDLVVFVYLSSSEI
jgi:hypothetical protein